MPQITDVDAQRVKDLVKQRDIAGARKLLQRFKGERAVRMLAQLDEKYPPKTVPPRSRSTQQLLIGGVVVAIVLSFLALAGVLIGLKRQQDAYQPLADLFNATPLPTWTPPYNSPVEAMAWVCHGAYEKDGLSESALVQACQKEAELLYQEHMAEVDQCYTANPEQLDFLQCAIDQELAFSFDGKYIEAAEGS